jgi:sulfite exporter TauE/SafE
LIAGLIAGLFGAALTAGGQWFGMQSLAARLVGVAMIAFAIIRLAKWAFPQWWQPKSSAAVDGAGLETVSAVGSGGWSQRISRWVASQRPWIARLPLLVRGYAAGALTTLLPCGWLYLFVLIAMGSGGVLPSMVVMGAFWIGTVPALTVLVVGAFRLAPRLRPWLPLAGSLLLLVTGLYTATGRAEADLRPLTQRVASMANKDSSASDSASVDGVIEAMNELVKEPLPCCVDREDRSE